ncbi:methyl-accepting chemotaxis protein [Rhodoferax ferrireducens]|uniref:methyl-accepting chemotaxis protein n=1 Tax=Rhodoferax ferrireducens TaxID=192843 RepID=UPI000E0D8514|nr:methyl-accepting chemotaxis protein [Rhodoferax ferrireducens]
MKNFKISTRLFLLIAVLSTLLIVTGGLGLYGISKTNTSLEVVYQGRTVPVGRLGSINALILNNRLMISNNLLDPTRARIAKYNAEIEANIKQIDKELDAYMATKLTLEETRLATLFKEAKRKLHAQGMLPAIAALNAHDLEEAQSIVFEKLAPLYDPVRDNGKLLVQLQLDEAKAEFDGATSRYAIIRMASIASIIGGVFFALFLGSTLVRGISRSLTRAQDGANAVAQGDLSHIIKIDGKDEITQVLMALSAMQTGLANVVVHVREGSECVATASAEIAQGNYDLSARTEQQASALEETAASMAELSDAVIKNADNASRANELAMSASCVAARGGEVVAQVVETMKGINDSSKKISDIISVIDGIAFQTNILALNAAVEAARAGEQGRGFAVVASEVRSLAGRSAEAAKEIKSLIGASVDRVEQGSALVDQAGVTMAEVVSSIKRVTVIMNEISAASSEQRAGVAQVSEAITQVDHATQQNAALVEEIAAAASSLKSQAQDLVQTVAIFKLDGSGQTQTSSQEFQHPSYETPLTVGSSVGRQNEPDCLTQMPRA